MANALSAQSATTVDSGATLDLGGYNQTVSSPAGAGTVTNSGASPAVLTNQGASSTFSGVIQDGATTATTGLTQNAPGNTLTLAGANTYSGPTTVQAGTLMGGAPNAFSAASATTVAGGATLDLGGFNQTVSSLAGAGTVTNSGTADAILTNVGASSTFSGSITNGATNTTGLTQNSAGNTLTLSGTNTYSGPTTVEAGTLMGGATNAFSAASATTVQTGGTLDLGGFSLTQTINSVILAGGVIQNGRLNGSISGGGTINGLAARRRSILPASSLLRDRTAIPARQ